MLKARNILCLSVPPWNGNYAATIVELMKVLGTQNKVLYVHNPYGLKEFLTALISRKPFPFAAVLGLGKRVKQQMANDKGSVYLMIPPLLLTINFLPPGVLYNSLARFNGWILRSALKRELRKLGMMNDLINITAFNPVIGMLTGRRLGEKLLLYHCYDEIGHAVWMKKHGSAAEKKFMQLADATVVTSRGLFESKKGLTANCFLVKNAADISLFNQAFQPDPPAIPTVGFIGSLDNRIDYPLLRHLVAAMPGLRFQLIGRIVDESGVTLLREFGNVELPGALPLAELPERVKHFSAGIIPFVKNEFTRGIYPLKINEYLAAGIPVVSTNFSYLEEFEQVISIANNTTEFEEFLLQEIRNDSTERKVQRQQAAAANTWESRVEQLSDIITTLENKFTHQS